jgi:hypothetical protein
VVCVISFRFALNPIGSLYTGLVSCCVGTIYTVSRSLSNLEDSFWRGPGHNITYVLPSFWFPAILRRVEPSCNGSSGFFKVLRRIFRDWLATGESEGFMGPLFIHFGRFRVVNLHASSYAWCLPTAWFLPPYPQPPAPTHRPYPIPHLHPRNPPSPGWKIGIKQPFRVCSYRT